MKFKIIKPDKPEPIHKSSIHRTGRIGFTIQAANKFGIEISKSVILAINQDDTEDKNIYGILSPKEHEDGYKIQKAGNYHSVDSKGFFDTIKIDYSRGDLSYNLTEEIIDGQKVLKFVPNPRKANRKQEKES